MMDLLLYIITVATVGIMGMYLGMRATLEAFERMESDRLRRIIRELRDGEDVLHDIGKRTEFMPLTFSAANDLILAYNACTGEFVSQGKDNEEMLAAAIERFPGRFFVLGSEQLSQDKWKEQG